MYPSIKDTKPGELYKCTLEVGGMIITFSHVEIVNCQVNKLYIY